MTNKVRWICAAATFAAVLAALGAGVWFGGGPAAREGWEAASWAAGVTGALGIALNVLVWAATQSPPPAPNARGKDDGNVSNTVQGTLSGGTIIQARDVGGVHVDTASYKGDLNDFRGSTFNGTFINKQHHHPSVSRQDEEPK